MVVIISSDNPTRRAEMYFPMYNQTEQAAISRSLGSSAATDTARLCIASSLRKMEARIKLDPSPSVVAGDDGSRQIEIA